VHISLPLVVTWIDGTGYVVSPLGSVNEVLRGGESVSLPFDAINRPDVDVIGADDFHAPRFHSSRCFRPSANATIGIVFNWQIASSAARGNHEPPHQIDAEHTQN
jgi:hypothetical protein